jgi:hypothetical protein
MIAYMEVATLHMKNVWYVLNIAAIVLGLREGYASTAPEQLRHMNPDAALCGIILFTMPVFALLSVGYSNGRRRRLSQSQHNLVRPSFHRNPFDWWGDPLQSLFISTCIMVNYTFGGVLRRPAIGSVGFWLVGSYACCFIGLAIGQILIYRIYGDQVVEEATPNMKFLSPSA